MSADGTEYPRFSDLLIRVGAERSREAFAAIFDHFAPRIKTYLCKQGADPVQAEEVVQDVMLTIWRKADQYDPARASASTWIFRIARNRSIDLSRKTARPALEPDDPVLAPVPLETPEPRLLRRELASAVRTEVSNLSSMQRDLLHAAFYDGLTHAQIADRFELPLGTVKSRLRAAFASLRENLTIRKKV